MPKTIFIDSTPDIDRLWREVYGAGDPPISVNQSPVAEIDIPKSIAGFDGMTNQAQDVALDLILRGKVGARKSRVRDIKNRMRSHVGHQPQIAASSRARRLNSSDLVAGCRECLDKGRCGPGLAGIHGSAGNEYDGNLAGLRVELQSVLREINAFTAVARQQSNWRNARRVGHSLVLGNHGGGDTTCGNKVATLQVVANRRLELVRRVATQLTKARFEKDRQFMALSEDVTPLPRPGPPEDIADAIFFLASDRAVFINGHILAVDGGWSSTNYSRRAMDI